MRKPGKPNVTYINVLMRHTELEPGTRFPHTYDSESPQQNSGVQPDWVCPGLTGCFKTTRQCCRSCINTLHQKGSAEHVLLTYEYKVIHFAYA